MKRLWSNQRRRGYPSKKEGDLEDNLIRPLLRMLGFTKSDSANSNPCYSLFPSLYGSGRVVFEPDYALFASGKDLLRASNYKKSQDNQFFSFSIGVGDAKAWTIDLDKKGGRDSPAQQILKYLVHSRKRYGFVTNGRQWRLYRASSAEALLRPDSFLQVELDDILTADDKTLSKWHEYRKASGEFEAADERVYWLSYFALFFGPEAFVGDGPVPYRGKELLEQLFAGSLKERVEIQDDLKERVFNCLQTACQGFYNCPHWRGSGSIPPSEQDLRSLYSSSLLFLYRLLFILNAEARGLLDSVSYQSISLTRLAGELERKLKGIVQQKLAPTYNYWKRILDLFEVISSKERAEEVGVTHYDGGLFDPSLRGHEYLEVWMLDDSSLHDLLQSLVFTEVLVGQNKHQRIIDYGTLEVRHLGQIYEGLLEYNLKYADNKLHLVDGKYVVKPPTAGIAEGIVDENTLYLATDKMARRVTGTYYTPDHIVDHIIQTTLGPKCREISDWNDLLELRVLDPAMGSGHFLVAAIDFIAGSIYSHPEAQLPLDLEASDDVDELILWKRVVAEHCVYGVDRNPLAVELAKLSIWLGTANKGKALSFLDAQLRCGDSLLGATLKELDAPPLELRRGKRVRTGALQQSTFDKAIEEKITSIAGISERISKASASTAAEIAALREAYKRSVRGPLASIGVLADIWMNQWFIVGESDKQASASKGKTLTEREYTPILESAIAGALTSGRTEKEPRKYFHWELEFPHILGLASTYGFDIIIGNPPYEVLASKEIGESVEQEKFFFKKSGFYELAVGGKLNLFNLFIVRCLQLLKQAGLFSMIVPITLLGSTQSRGLRDWLLTCDNDARLQQRCPLQPAGLAEVYAFPQKDVAERRVFKDAKQATCIFLVSGNPRCPSEITVRTYPWGDFNDEPKTYSITSEQVRLLDESEFVIPHSASSQEIDLALRLAVLPSFVKLSEIATIAQGEFNITTSKRKGLITEQHGDENLLVLRGAHIARYRLQEAKQGTELFVIPKALKAYAATRERTKLDDISKSRLILQEASPADNYRRLIATCVDGGRFCGHTINYVTDIKSQDIYAVLAVFNSTVSEWRFRLTSTTNHVSGREVGNILVPVYAFSKDLMLIEKNFQEEKGVKAIERIWRERNKRIEEHLQSIASGDVRALNTQLMESIRRNRGQSCWPDEVHDALAALSRRLCQQGETINTKVYGFLDWLDDYLKTETRKWKGSSAFRLFHNLDFQTFFQMCKKNGFHPGPEERKVLLKEFGKVEEAVRESNEESRRIEDIVDESLFLMMNLSIQEISMVKRNSGRRMPSA